MDSVQPSKTPLKPIRAEFVAKETLCFRCHKKARKVRRRLYVYAECPVTGERVPVRIHPQPRLYATCDCGNRWKRNIPKGSIREVF